MVRPLTERHYYLNFAETSQPRERQARSPACREDTVCEQAVRSLGPLGCTCYQACARGLSTRWSAWDLHHSLETAMGTLILGAASRLDAVSASPFWT